MTTVLLFVAFLVVAVAGFGLALARLCRHRDRPSDLTPLSNTLSPARVYRPIARLFDEQDWRFLSRQKGYRPGMDRHLHRWRRKALSSYLRQVRRDFHQVWALCRTLARTSRDPQFATLALRQFMVFHALYMVLQVRCVFGFVPLPVNGFELVGALDRLHRGAKLVMQSPEEESAPALSRS